jgi:CRP/FNR family cyclic AMP-dependent transcriptional regulator
MNLPVEHTIEHHPAGTVIFRQGDDGDAMYVIESGSVEIRRRINEQENVLAVLGPGQFFGEMAILNSRPRSATAVVRRDARFRVIAARDFLAYMAAQEDLVGGIIRTLAERLDQANHQAELFMHEHPDHRMVHSLCHAAEEQVYKGEGGRGAVYIPFTLMELAERASVSWDEAVDVVERLALDGLIIPACAADIDARGYVVAEAELLMEFLSWHKPVLGRPRRRNWHGMTVSAGSECRSSGGVN